MKQEQQEKQTTKECPRCGNTQLLLFTTLNRKSCPDCHIDIPWYVEDGQEHLIKYQR
jgi:ribosomal protein S27AE